MERDYAAAVRVLLGARKVVVFTGAGMSKDSGIDTYRGKDGVWEKYNVEDVATLEGFIRDPEKVWHWNDARRQRVLKIDPHPGYEALMELEGLFDDVVVVTQNIDGLHNEAGSSRVIELHGNIWKVRCAAEDNEPWEDRRVPLPEIPPVCECGGFIRPHLVWFGESLEPQVLEGAMAASGDCDAMLVVGTSAVVYPAAGIPWLAKRNCAAIVEVNIDPTPVTEYADVSLLGPAAEVLPELVKRLKETMGKGGDEGQGA
jgi:NAD-dependent deacetylase